LIIAAVQAFTKIGFTAQCVALAALASGLLVSNGALRAVGLLGLVLALAPVRLLAFTTYIHAKLIILILIAHSIWTVGRAYLLGAGWFNRSRAFTPAAGLAPKFED
jgi:hypothetical protein